MAEAARWLLSFMVLMVQGAARECCVLLFWNSMVCNFVSRLVVKVVQQEEMVMFVRFEADTCAMDEEQAIKNQPCRGEDAKDQLDSTTTFLDVQAHVHESLVVVLLTN
ncbi:hypothetical protein Droror1_Dr00025391 [Drosera rotundifolia]